MRPFQQFVCHVHHSSYDVYIGRPSAWGNPFKIGEDGNRMVVLEKYRQWLLSQPEKVALVKKHLRGKMLGCWCYPQPCHGEILAEIANSEEEATP